MKPMRLIERLKRILLRVRAKPEWPPRREYVDLTEEVRK